MTGKSFRLPTEAEWEYAAMGGQIRINARVVTDYQNPEIAWYDNNSRGSTHTVGQKRPNDLGLYDMTIIGFGKKFLMN